MKHLIGQTHNGVEVYVQLIGSKAGEHIARQPQLLALAKEVLVTATLHDQKTSIEYDMKRLIGYCPDVETTDNDVVFYGRLVKDDVYSRFVKNRKAPSTRYLTVTLTKESNSNYELSDIWIGRLMPPRPGSANETAESKAYWSNHALVMDGQPLQLQSVTKTCPY